MTKTCFPTPSRCVHSGLVVVPVPRTAVPLGQEITAETAAKRLKVGELAAPPTF